MVSDTKAFCETCSTCKQSKLNNQKPYGLLNPLAVPTKPWESIGMDFVGPLHLQAITMAYLTPSPLSFAYLPLW